jgi:hypothetical protein
MVGSQRCLAKRGGVGVGKTTGAGAMTRYSYRSYPCACVWNDTTGDCYRALTQNQAVVNEDVANGGTARSVPLCPRQMGLLEQVQEGERRTLLRSLQMASERGQGATPRHPRHHTATFSAMNTARNAAQLHTPVDVARPPGDPSRLSAARQGARHRIRPIHERECDAIEPSGETMPERGRLSTRHIPAPM